MSITKLTQLTTVRQMGRFQTVEHKKDKTCFNKCHMKMLYSQHSQQKHPVQIARKKRCPNVPTMLNVSTKFMPQIVHDDMSN